MLCLNGEINRSRLCGKPAVERVPYNLEGQTREVFAEVTRLLEAVTCPDCLVAIDRLLGLGYTARRAYATKRLDGTYSQACYWKRKHAPKSAVEVRFARASSIRGWLRARGLDAEKLRAGVEPQPTKAPAFGGRPPNVARRRAPGSRPRTSRSALDRAVVW